MKVNTITAGCPVSFTDKTGLTFFILFLSKMKSPSFKMVLTAVGEFAYRRKEDDVLVCPLWVLNP